MSGETMGLPLALRAPQPVLPRKRPSLIAELESFREFGTTTRRITTTFQLNGKPAEVPAFVNEFWTAKQRAASRLHEISYRACFKPQLPRFFIERLTQPGDVVYDPFMGRGTTPLEAALHGRIPFGCDINPLSAMLTRPRFNPPTLEQVGERLDQIGFQSADEFPEDLLVFYHPETLREIASLKKYLLARRHQNSLD